MNEKLTHKKIVIIGQGKVGQSLAGLLSFCGHSVSNLGRDYAQQMPLISNAKIIIICVNDAAIERVCNNIANNINQQSIVCHCSGALDSTVLEAAVKVGGYTASCHPLNTFPTLASSLEKFASTEHGSYLYAEGHANALNVLLPLFEDAGFIGTLIQREAKPLYHAACVFACNYLTSLMDMSLETATKAGLEPESFWASLQPLIQSTIDNIGNQGVAASLSGPISRGDTITVKTHIQALSVDASLQSDYASLGLRALKIAAEKEQLNHEQITSIRTILTLSD